MKEAGAGRKERRGETQGVLGGGYGDFAFIARASIELGMLYGRTNEKGITTCLATGITALPAAPDMSGRGSVPATECGCICGIPVTHTSTAPGQCSQAAWTADAFPACLQFPPSVNS